MKRQIQTFLTQEDESTLSKILKGEFVGIKFLNDNVWPQRPDTRDGIEMCDSGRVYIFDGELDEIPTFVRKSGELEGPAAGCVIQILRSSLADGTLRSGRIAAGIDDQDHQMREFVQKVWKCLKEIGEIGVRRPDGDIDKHYLVGRSAKQAVADGELVIADRAVGMKFELIS